VSSSSLNRGQSFVRRSTILYPVEKPMNSMESRVRFWDREGKRTHNFRV
jgi:hypothetical protein